MFLVKISDGEGFANCHHAPLVEISAGKKFCNCFMLFEFRNCSRERI